MAEDLHRMRAMVEPQHERLATIERGLAILPGLAADLETVRATVEPQHERVAVIEQAVLRLEARLADRQSTLASLKGEVEDAAEHLPDPMHQDRSPAPATP